LRFAAVSAEENLLPASDGEIVRDTAGDEVVVAARYADSRLLVVFL